MSTRSNRRIGIAQWILSRNWTLRPIKYDDRIVGCFFSVGLFLCCQALAEVEVETAAAAAAAAATAVAADCWRDKWSHCSVTQAVARCRLFSARIDRIESVMDTTRRCKKRRSVTTTPLTTLFLCACVSRSILMLCEAEEAPSERDTINIGSDDTPHRS